VIILRHGSHRGGADRVEQHAAVAHDVVLADRRHAFAPMVTPACPLSMM